jgi:hypothetical protein
VAAAKLSNDTAESAEAKKLRDEVMTWANSQMKDLAATITATIQNRAVFLKDLKQQ